MVNNITKIPQRMKSSSINDPYVAEAKDIIDENLHKDQEQLNGFYDEITHDVYRKEEVNNIVSRTPETDVIVIEVPAASNIAAWLDANTPSGIDPETGKSVRANKLYRVPGPDNTTFSEWAWDGTKYTMLANKDYGIDNMPTPGSNNMAKSSGIFAKILNTIDIPHKIADEVLHSVQFVERKINNPTVGYAWVNSGGNVSRVQVSNEWASADDPINCSGYSKVAYRGYGTSGHTLLILTTDEGLILKTVYGVESCIVVENIPSNATKVYVNIPPKNDYIDNILYLIEDIAVTTDETPVENSDKPVSSGGMYSVLKDSESGFVDNEPTPGSDRIVMSGGTKAAIFNADDALHKIVVDALSNVQKDEVTLEGYTDGVAWADVDNSVTRIAVSPEWKSVDNPVNCYGYQKVAFRCYGINGQTVIVFSTDNDEVLSVLFANGEDWNIVNVPAYATRMYINIPPANDYIKNTLYLIKSVTLNGYDEIKGDVVITKEAVEVVSGRPTGIVFPLDLNGSVSNSAWVGNIGGSIETIKQDQYSRMLDPISYSGGTVYLHQTVGSGQTPFVFTDDDNVVLGFAYSGSTVAEMKVTPPTGTTRIYWSVNKSLNESLGSVYLTIKESLEDRITRGGMIVIPEGVYEIHSTISVPSNTKIVGTNGKTVIKAVNTDIVFDISGDTENVEFHDLTIEGTLPIDNRLLLPTKTELQTEQTISKLPFEVYKSDCAYVPDNGKISEMELSGWNIMAPIEYKGGNIIIRQYANPGQRILYCCDDDGNILNTFSGNNSYTVYGYDINPSTTHLYWTCPTPNISYATMYTKKDVVSENGIGIYIHNGTKGVVLDNCVFKYFSLAGVKAYKTLGSSYRYAPKVNLCKFYNNINGVIFAERAEFATLTNCEFSHNQIGIWTCASNTNFGSCQISQNFSDGLVFVGGYENSVHTVVSNCEIVHNGYNAGNAGTPKGTYDVAFINADAGISLTGCLIGIDGILLFNSAGVLVTACQLICPVYIDTPRGCNAMHSNMWRKHAGLGVVINGPQTNISLKDNRFVWGDYSDINNNN